MNRLSLIVVVVLSTAACGSSHSSSAGGSRDDAGVGGTPANTAGTGGAGAGGAGTGGAGTGGAGTGGAATGGAASTDGSPGLGPLPAWRQGVPKWQWVEIVGSSLGNVKVPDPFSGDLVAPTQRIDAWNGLAANRDTNRVYLAGAGGHADWAGNEAYEIDLQVDAPAWRLLRGPTMAPDVQASNGSMGIFHHYYADGRPSSTHLYFALQFVRGRNRIFKMCAGSIWGSGNESNNKVDGFDLAKNDWDPAGTWAETPGGSPPSPTADRPTIARAFAQHPETEDIYTYFTGAFRKWSAADATWSELAARPGYANDDIVSESPAAVDPIRNRVLFSLNAYHVAQKQGLSYAIGDGTLTDVTYTGAGAASAVGGSRGLVFLPTEDAYFMKLPAGKTVARIHPSTYEVTDLATTGPTPPDAVNGIYTRWLYLPRLKGVAYLPSGAANMWFLATE